MNTYYYRKQRNSTNYRETKNSAYPSSAQTQKESNFELENIANTINQDSIELDNREDITDPLPTFNVKESNNKKQNIVNDIQELSRPQIVGKNRAVKYTNYVGSSVRHSMARRDYFK